MIILKEYAKELQINEYLFETENEFFAYVEDMKKAFPGTRVKANGIDKYVLIINC